VGEVNVGGGALPSVRVEVNPTKLNSKGLTLQDVQSVLSLQNADQPTGQLYDDLVTADIITNDQISRAEDYKPLVIEYSNGAAIRLSDVADVLDSTQNVRPLAC
jgi:multidrug efflux pump